jgi:hypothetical protein
MNATHGETLSEIHKFLLQPDMLFQIMTVPPEEYVHIPADEGLAREFNFKTTDTPTPHQKEEIVQVIHDVALRAIKPNWKAGLRLKQDQQGQIMDDSKTTQNFSNGELAFAIVSFLGWGKDKGQDKSDSSSESSASTKNGNKKQKLCCGEDLKKICSLHKDFLFKLILLTRLGQLLPRNPPQVAASPAKTCGPTMTPSKG